MNEDNEKLRGRVAPIEMSAEEFREVGHRLVDDIADFIGSIREYPVARDLKPSEVRAVLPGDALPEEGMDAAALMKEITPALFNHSLFNGHPRFLAYITSSAAPIGALGDLLAASINPNVGGWQLSPMGTEIEKQSVRWIADMIGFPTDCGGLFVSGGNMANLVCFLAARRAKADWDVRKDGVAKGGREMTVYASAETHTWIQKALDMFGHGEGHLRRIPVDAELCAEIGALRQMIETDKAEGHLPFLIVGTGGSVSTGAIDDLPAMAEIAKEHDMWFHVDGAYGALAAVLPDAPAELKGLSKADSVAVDPHKWLYSPLEAGCALVRDPEGLVDAFSYRPPYYHFESEDEPKTNFYEYGMQNSRGFRALKTWLGLRHVGRRGYQQMIADDIRLAKEIYRLMDAHPETQALTHALSITTFRYVPADLEPGSEKVDTYLNELNETLLERLKVSGEVFVSNAILDGAFVLRTCVVNFRTALEDVEALPEIVVRHGREADRELRRKNA